jgi:hypothetical protein
MNLLKVRKEERISTPWIIKWHICTFSGSSDRFPYDKKKRTSVAQELEIEIFYWESWKVERIVCGFGALEKWYLWDV